MHIYSCIYIDRITIPSLPILLPSPPPPPPKHNPRHMIRKKLRFSRQTLRPRTHALRKFKLIIHQEVDHDHFDFIAGEKPAGAGVAAVSERHAVEIAGCVL